MGHAPKSLRIRSCICAFLLVGFSGSASAQEFDSVVALTLNNSQNLTNALKDVTRNKTLTVNDIKMQAGSPRQNAFGGSDQSMPATASIGPKVLGVAPAPSAADVSRIPSGTPVPAIRRPSQLQLTFDSDITADLPESTSPIAPLVAGHLDTAENLIPFQIGAPESKWRSRVVQVW